MRRIKSRMELYASLHLNKAEIERLFMLSESEARQVYVLARKKDLKDLGEEKIIFPNKVRTSSVLYVMDVSIDEFYQAYTKEKSGLALEKPSALEVVE